MAVVNIADLPPVYQAQALRKLTEGKPGVPAASETERDSPPAKYRNEKTTRTLAGSTVLRFDSLKEARRYDELALMLAAGEISDLRLQADFTLQEAYTDSGGQRIRAIRYKADFTYRSDGVFVVEDVKSKPTRTREYIMKKKMLKDRMGISITEV